MKRILFSLSLILLTSLGVQAQKERDFADHFVEEHTETAFQVRTISPQMVERMLALQTVETDTELSQILSQIKSIRMVQTSENGSTHLENVNLLAQRNAKRYKVHRTDDTQSIYIRQRKETIVEVVVAIIKNNAFMMFDITGKMDPKFIEKMDQWDEIIQNRNQRKQKEKLHCPNQCLQRH